MELGGDGLIAFRTARVSCLPEDAFAVHGRAGGSAENGGAACQPTQRRGGRLFETATIVRRRLPRDPTKRRRERTDAAESYLERNVSDGRLPISQ